MLVKHGIILIDSRMSNDAVADVLSVQFDLLFFRSVDVFEKYLTLHAEVLKLFILHGSAKDSQRMLKALRDRAFSVPSLVIVDEANSEKISEFQRFGASDLLFEPFKTGELLYRCERLLQHLEGFKLLPNVVNGVRIRNLTFKERRLLTVFLSVKTGGIIRSELFEAVWNSVAVHRKTLDVHLFNLRKKLRQQGFDIIHSENTYRLESAVASCEPLEAALSQDAQQL
ncbi:MAG: hypothetical protein EOP06_25590 [Proteobacteria bacterium]|nr:MAG: hypothetical protein EOP06_25590 [Pseudomonadota bacterium]